MIAPPNRPLFFLIALFMLHCQDRSPNHLVIDAGSSGSRLCAYSVEDDCRSALFEGCQDIAARGGLAELSAQEQEGVLRLALQSIPRSTSVALAGTGGFRSLNTTGQATSMERISGYLKRLGFQRVSARVISGEEEASLAWQAVGRATGSQNHSIIEAGGASIQAAERERAISLPLGINVLISGLAHNQDFEVCYDAILPGLRSFQACQNLIKKEIRDKFPGSLEKLRLKDRHRVYLLGQSASALFELLGKQTFSLQELNTRSSEICLLGETGLKELKIEKKFQRRTCFLFAYASVLLEASRADQIIESPATWRDSLAVHPDFFSACQIKKQIDR